MIASYLSPLQCFAKQSGEARDSCLSGRGNVLHEVVDLHRNRILCRLRSRHARMSCNFKKKKSSCPPWVPELCRKLGHQGMDTSQKMLSSPTRLQFLGTHSASIFQDLEILDSRAAASTSGLDVVKTIDALAKEIKTHRPPLSVLEEIKSLGKINRYIRMTNLVVRYSRRCEIFKNIKIIPIKLQPTRCLAVEPDEVIADATRRLLSTSRGEVLRNAARQTSFEDAVELMKHATTSKHPVHAEIQLLGHYEITSSEPRPRIISSNKQAYFLCNLFFRIHGVLIIGSSHGRLYEKWALPGDLLMSVPSSRPKIITTIRDFGDQISRRIEEELNLRQARFPPPEESIVSPSGTGSTLTVVSHSKTRQDLEDRITPGSPKRKPDRIDETSLALSGTSRSTTLSSTSSRKPMFPGNALLTGNTCVLSDWVLRLQQGVLVSMTLSERSRDISVHTPKIHLTFSTISEYYNHKSTILKCSGAIPSYTSQTAVQVEWLRDDHD